MSELGYTSDGAYVGLRLATQKSYELIFPNPDTDLALLLRSDDLVYGAVRGVI